MKRFYSNASVQEEDKGVSVRLDGRPVRTPGRARLVLPTRALAEAVAAEWRAQPAEIKPAALALTRLANSTIDAMPAQRERVIDELVAHGDTDLVCYRAAEPLALVRRQRAAWQPVLDHAAERFGAALVVTQGVIPVAQPPEALAALRRTVAASDDWALVGLHAATTACGSLLLALALQDGRLSAEAAWRASLLDELYTIEQWGADAEATRRHDALLRDVTAAAQFMALATA